MKRLFRGLVSAVCAFALCLSGADALSVEQAIALLEEEYIDPLPVAAYEAKTLDELFAAAGDPYTYYMDAEENKRFFAQVEGEQSVTGIGAGIELTAEGIRVTAVLDGGGAKEAGLARGDLIIAVDGVSCVPAGEAHRGLILGEEGTWVTLTVRHGDGAVSDCRIRRRTVAIHNTTVTVEEGTGFIDCDSFGSQTEAYFEDSIERNDARVTQWVVDLRGNLGGLADAAAGALGAFTGPGRKLYCRLADGGLNQTVYLPRALTEKPVIVLVDGSSASASEIFSGGILAEQAGIVIGSRTYGKGTAQIILDEAQYPELFDGDALKVTAYRFYRSDGNTTDRIGVLPTLLVRDEYADETAALLSAQPPASGEALRIPLNGRMFYVDIDAVRAGGYTAALGELFSALAPDVPIYCPIDGLEIALDPRDAAAYYGVESPCRVFGDSAVSPYAAQIDTLAVYGLLSGDGAGRFHPGKALTRRELAVMLAEALNAAPTHSAGFSDVTGDCADAVNAVTCLGLMDGVGGGRFDPDGTLTQEQLIAVMGRLARFLNFQADDYALALSDDELAVFDRFQPWARAAAAVLTGYDGNMLFAGLSAVSPDAPATREQAAATLCNLLKTMRFLSY